MGGGGYYRMHRGWMEHPAFGREPFTRALAWCWLIEHAAWSDTTQSVGRHFVRVHRGQLAVAVRYLAEAWGWSKSSVDRFLKRLESETMIGTQAGTQFTIVTICNYDRYQSSAEDGGTLVGTEVGTRPGHDRDKEEEKKEGKNDSHPELFCEEAIPTPAANLDAMFEQWWEMFPRYRRGSKGPARKKWLAIVRRKAATPDALLDGMRRYLAAGYGDSHFACGAERWLNDERWTVQQFPPPGDIKDIAHRSQSHCSSGEAISDDLMRELQAAKANGRLEEFLAEQRHRPSASPQKPQLNIVNGGKAHG